MSKTLYLCSTANGREFEVEDAAQSEGLDVWAFRQVQLKRIGKDRKPTVIESPYYGRYVFAWLTPAQFYQFMGLRYVSRTCHAITPREAAAIQEARLRNEAEAQQERARLAAEERLTEFNKGDRLRINNTVLSDVLARFEAVRIDPKRGPRLMVEAEFMGRPTLLDVDPLHVKAGE